MELIKKTLSVNDALGWYLTQNEYKVHSEGSRGYLIINDVGRLSWYPFSCFE
jgi:hypothetical protein